MSTKRIDIRKPAQIDITNIHVYGTSKKLLTNAMPKNAEKVKLRIGVFFDGTGNNSYNSDAVYYRQELPLISTEKYKVKHKGFITENGSSYFNRYSNVKLLHDLYETKSDDNTNPRLKLKDPHHYVQLKVYVQGIGTLRDEEDDAFGTSFGEGKRGVISRVNEACNDIATAIDNAFIAIKNNNKKPLFIESIEFDVFGFSRGAAAARHFCNEVLKQKNVNNNIKIKEETIPVAKDKVRNQKAQIALDNNREKKPLNTLARAEKEFTGGALGEALKAKKIVFPVKNVVVDFLGLFDKVIAQLLEKKGVIDFTRDFPFITLPFRLSPVLQLIGAGAINKVGQIKKVNPDVSNPYIKKVFHIVASNEWRENFAITPINNFSSRGSIRVLGAHSNIGGCYNNIDFELNVLHFFDLPLDATANEISKATNLKSKLRQWYINNLFCEDDQDLLFWETMHHVKVYDVRSYNPISNEPIFSNFSSGTALIKNTILGDQTEKIIENKKYQLVAYHYLLQSKRKLNNKLSLVYMNVMKDMATKYADVPFLNPTDKNLIIAHPEEYYFDENYKLDQSYNSTESYQSVMNRVAEHGWSLPNEEPIEHNDLIFKENGQLTYKIPVKLYEDIKLHYVHLSANFNETLPKAEQLSEYQFVYPNVPNLTFEDDYKEPPYQREQYTPELNASDKR